MTKTAIVTNFRKYRVFYLPSIKIYDIITMLKFNLPSWSSGSRRRPLTAETRVRFPMGVPKQVICRQTDDLFFW